MSRIELLLRRYAASASLLRTGVEIIAVGDPSGAAFDYAVRQLVTAAREDGDGPWEELLRVSKALRWRRLTQPQPTQENEGLLEGCEALDREVRRLRGSVVQDSVLDALARTSAAMIDEDSPVGALVTRSVTEVGSGNCVVVVARRAAHPGVERWLRTIGVQVLLPVDLEAALGEVDLVYAVGPPRFFPPSMVTAPLAGELTFITPAWFTDLSLPRSALAQYAEGRVVVRSHVNREGDLDIPAVEIPAAEALDEDEMLPSPAWTRMRRPDRHPDVTEVEARKVLLSGGWALWLDDGERIRAVDPRQPAGERVVYADVEEVAPGTYLLVRTGITERRALYDAALALLGPLAPAVDESQASWKRRLSEELLTLGYNRVVRALTRAGVRASERARAWTDPNLIRPHSDDDFDLLLTWLGVASEPAVTHANRLRRALYQASADIREELENAVSQADLDALESNGSLALEIESAGFRGIMATRVLAVSPTTQIVQRRDARVLFPDGDARWLE
jgi:hypothetical protein